MPASREAHEERQRSKKERGFRGGVRIITHTEERLQDGVTMQAATISGGSASKRDHAAFGAPISRKRSAPQSAREMLKKRLGIS